MISAPLQIHLVSLVENSGEFEQAYALLNHAERLRAERLKVESARLAFVMTRAALRRRLGEGLSVEPGALEFAVGPHGKPRLADASLDARVAFNVSHTDALALIAIGPGGSRIGVDVETIRESTPCEKLVDRYFTAGEAAAWGALPAARRLRAFFQLWTRKESLLKATGAGISAGLKAFEFDIDPDLSGNPRRVRADGPSKLDGEWHVADLQLAASHVAAVALDRPIDIAPFSLV